MPCLTIVSYSNSVPNGYELPDGLAMYMGNPSSNDKKLLTRYANWSCSEAAKEIQTSTTYLEDSYWSLGASDKQPGWGWE